MRFRTSVDVPRADHRVDPGPPADPSALMLAVAGSAVVATAFGMARYGR